MLQRSDEWFKARLGKVTASKINDAIAKLKSGEPAATRRNYMAQLLCERLTGKASESYTNSAMQWGVDNEDKAREMYQFISGNDVQEIGFVDHPSIRMSGASPDGLIGDDGLIEIKCPNTATHIDYINSGAVPSEYKNQMLFQMSCTGRKWCDFVSFDPRLPGNLQLFIVRYDLDKDQEKIILDGINNFLSELDDTEKKLRAKI